MKRILLALAAITMFGFSASTANAQYCANTGRYIGPSNVRVVTNYRGGYGGGYRNVYANPYRGGFNNFYGGRSVYGVNNFYRGGFGPGFGGGFGPGFGYGGFGPGVSFGGGRGIGIRIGF